MTKLGPTPEIVVFTQIPTVRTVLPTLARLPVTLILGTAAGGGLDPSSRKPVGTRYFDIRTQLWDIPGLGFVAGSPVQTSDMRGVSGGGEGAGSEPQGTWGRQRIPNFEICTHLWVLRGVKLVLVHDLEEVIFGVGGQDE